jgi:hypothetical protein
VVVKVGRGLFFLPLVFSFQDSLRFGWFHFFPNVSFFAGKCILQKWESHFHVEWVLFFYLPHLFFYSFLSTLAFFHIFSLAIGTGVLSSPDFIFNSFFAPPTFIIFTPSFCLHYVLLSQILLVRGRIGFVRPFIGGEAS